MRAAMAEAEVGDDQFGADGQPPPGARRRTAGQGSRAWFPTGTMANQVVRELTSRARVSSPREHGSGTRPAAAGERGVS